MNNNKLEIFESKEFGDIRTLLIDNEVWFVGKDVASALGYKDTKDAISKHVDLEDKTIIQRGQFTSLEIPNRGLTVINESGLYSLVLSSKLPTAKEFKHWITSKVLPSIRKNGEYSIHKRLKKEYNHETIPLTKYYFHSYLSSILKSYRDVEDYVNLLIDRIDNEIKDSKIKQQLYNEIQSRLCELIEKDDNINHQDIITKSSTYLYIKELQGSHSRLRGKCSALKRIENKCNELQEQLIVYESLEKELKEELDIKVKEVHTLQDKLVKNIVKRLFNK